MSKEKAYEFTDKDIDYQISNTGGIYINIDPDRGLWAEIHAEDIEFMRKHKEKGNENKTDNVQQ